MRKWVIFEELPKRYLRAYERNASTNADFSENRLQNGALIFQSGGAFEKLKFRRAAMCGVCCGIMAAYNALTLSGREVDFLRLAAEFERGAAIPAIPAGAFGCDPFKIGRCFAAHGVKFAEYRCLEEFENALENGRVGVVGYKFGKLDPRMHLFAVERVKADISDGTESSERGEIIAYNRFSDSRKPDCFRSVREALSSGGKHRLFLTGYVLESSPLERRL